MTSKAIMRLALIVCGLAATSGGAALAKGDLATKGTKLPELILGQGDAGFGVSQAEYRIETGKLYQLEISATGKQECALRGEKFFASVYVRKAEVGGVEVKAPFFSEFEFEGEGEVELFFVPVRTGSFKLGCAGLEDKGMGVTIIVE